MLKQSLALGIILKWGDNMLVCGREDVYKYLSKGKIIKIYLTKEFNDKEILKLLKEINKDEEVIEIKYVERKDLDDMTDKEHEDIIGEVRKRFLLILLFIISISFLVFVTTGIAFSLFDIVNKDLPDINTETGQIILNYSDTTGVGNGIRLINAHAIKDREGINLRGDNEYFDFIVSGSTSHIPLTYHILIEKQPEANLSENNIKIYLTKLNGIVEEKIDDVHFISSLRNHEYVKKSNKLLYTKSFDESTDKFSDSYRIRIWIDENAKDYYNKRYSMKVNVYGEGR